MLGIFLRNVLQMFLHYKRQSLKLHMDPFLKDYLNLLLISLIKFEHL